MNNNIKIFLVSTFLLGSLYAKEYDDTGVYFRQGLVYDANTNELYTGSYDEYYESGELASKKEYKNGRLSGRIVLLRADGEVTEDCQYENGIRHGKCYLFGQIHALTTVLEIATGTYVNGKRDGVWEFYRPKVFYDNTSSNTYLSSKGSYSQGKKIGKWEMFNKNGDLVGGGDHDENGNPTGKWVIFTYYGYTEEGKFINGKQNGVWILRYPDGKLCTRKYYDGIHKGKDKCNK